jgi:Ner family transcriptional regulator
MSMRTNQTAQSTQDWHPADVIAALRKRGTSLRQIALGNGYSHINRVLTSPWLAAEQLVAQALELTPADIWPSRYLSTVDRTRARQLTRKISIAPSRGVRRTRRTAAEAHA